MEEMNSTSTKKILNLNGRLITLIGTAHVSSQSVAEVRAAIQNDPPECVAVELDAGRFDSMMNEQKYKELDIISVLRRGEALLVLANLILGSFQKRMGQNTGVRPGDEMKEAVNIAKENSIPFELVDRPIKVTLNRAWAKNSFWGKCKLLSALIASAFSKEEVSQEEIESLKKQNEMDSMMKELADFLPAVKEVLIDERDRFLACKIWECKAALDEGGTVAKNAAGLGEQGTAAKNAAALDEGEATALGEQNAAGEGDTAAKNATALKEQNAAGETNAGGGNDAAKNATALGEQNAATKAAAKNGGSLAKSVVAVLGAGHLPGVQSHLEKIASGKENTDTAAIANVPPKSLASKIAGAIIPALIVALIAWGFYLGGKKMGGKMLGSWVVWNGALAAIGALAAGGHPLSVLTAFLGAPITSLCPFVGVGLFTGLVQAFVKKPKVLDMETLADDAASVKGFYKNRITRVLLVFFLSSLGSSIGTFVAGASIVKTLTEAVMNFFK